MQVRPLALTLLVAPALLLAGCMEDAAPLGEAEAAHSGVQCAAGEVVAGFSADGAPACVAPAHAGFACPAGEVVVGFDAEGSPACEDVMTVAQAAAPPPPPSRPAKSIAVTSSGPLADGVKTYTVASASPGMRWGDLQVSVDGVTLSRAEGCVPGEGEYAVCAGDDAPKAEDGDVTAGDRLAVAGAAGATLRLVDATSNSVMLSISMS